MSVWRSALLTGLIATCTQAASGQPKPSAARLRYDAPEGSRCPDEQAVRDAVAARLGYDPFSPTAAREVTARIRHSGGGLSAEVELRDADGRVGGLRRLQSAKGDCRELASAMELAMSIAVDPVVLTRPEPVAAPPAPPPPFQPAPPPTPQPAPPPSPAAVAAPPVVAARGERDRVSLRASVGTLVTLGSAPDISVGFTAQIGLRWRLVSFAIEGRADLPAATDVAGLGRVRASLLLASFVPCVHYRFLYGCALAALGAMQGAGENVDQPRQQSTFYAAAGPRLGAEIRLYKALHLGLHFDLLATLTRTTLQISNKDAWTTPPLSGNLGLSIAGNFP